MATRLNKPHWLPTPQLEQWLSLVSVFTLLPGALDAQLTKDSGLTHYEYMVMSMLAEANDRTLRMSELALRTNASLSRLSHVATKLEKRGLVARAACPDDARATDLRLTRSGLALWLESASGHLAEVRRLVVDNLTVQELATLANINRKLISQLDPEAKLELRKPKA